MVRFSCAASVAENTSDGYRTSALPPLLGGPILTMAYKAINTLDSPGYKTEKYRKIGLISAKMDDPANLIPARLTWLFLDSQQSRFYWMSKALRIGWQDRYQHASPQQCFFRGSCDWGPKGIQLGGPHAITELIEKPTIGEASRSIRADDIQTSLLYTSTMTGLILFTLLFSKSKHISREFMH